MHDAPDIAQLLAGLVTGDAHVRILLARQARSDCRDPLASGWIRRWSPRPAMLPLPRCTCHNGRCLVCN